MPVRDIYLDPEAVDFVINIQYEQNQMPLKIYVAHIHSYLCLWR